LTKVCFFLFAWPTGALAAFSNYNSVLIGNDAAGMGGAYTALTGDPAACSYYNPASLGKMEGNTLSAAVSVYSRYDTNYSDLGGFGQAPLRVNRGSITPLPASSGTVYTFGNFAFGLSIVFPDFDLYTGEVRNSTDVTSFLSQRDESLWVGGSLAINLTDQDSLGLTMYYTSRTFTRSVTDQSTVGPVTTVTSEEKILSQNSLIYILGYHREIGDRWTFGASIRLPSLPINGRGSYYINQISSGGGPVTPTVYSHISVQTLIPPRLNFGLAYSIPKNWRLAMDIHGYGSERYEDMDVPQASDRVEHKNLVNVSLGGEKYLKSWLALRAGIYTNLSSHPTIPDTPFRRYGDHLDMWGFSTTAAIFTSTASSVTLGGYYTGGKGYSTQRIGQSLTKVPKSQQIFTFLVGTAFHF